MKLLMFFCCLFLNASHVLAFGSLSHDNHHKVLTPALNGKSFSQMLPIEKNSADKMLVDAFKEKEIAIFKGWKDPFLESRTNKVTKEFQELDYKKNTGVSKKEKDNFYQPGHEKNEDDNSASVLNVFLPLLLGTANNVFLKVDTSDIHGIISLGNSKKEGAASERGDRVPEQNSEQARGQNQQASSRVKSGKRKRDKDAELNFDVSDLSPQEAAGHFLDTVNTLAREHDLSIERVIGHKKWKRKGFLRFYTDYATTKNNVKQIFVDFILFTEGLLRDQKFIYSDEADKYRSGQTISKERVEIIDSVLSEIFAHRQIEVSNRYDKNYYLGELLSDYLYENFKGYDDSRDYRLVGHKTFQFFERILFGDGYFSEYDQFMRFIDRYKKELFDEIRKNTVECNECKNAIIAALRINDELRMTFNKEVMASKFERRWLDALHDMFEEKPDAAGQSIPLNNSIDLKFGEELEYDLISKAEQWGGPSYYYLEIVRAHMERLGANEASCDSGSFTFDGHFYVTPFLDYRKWLEFNCTPYHDGDADANNALEKVFELVDSMIKDELIDHASGHKHVDALSATHGNPAVLLELQREIESNSYLLRAFGNNDRIVKDNESQWYKLFSDYSDMRELAIERINWMIATYNEKLAAFNYEVVNGDWLTDSEKLDKLKQFAKIYSHFVQMTPLQQMFGAAGNMMLEKYMAISLMHIPGSEVIDPYATIEFRFFRCPENMQELKLINQFLQAWFEYIHDRRMRNEPIEVVPHGVKASEDYTAEEVVHHTIQYLQKLGLNPDDYQSFLNKVSKGFSKL